MRNIKMAPAESTQRHKHPTNTCSIQQLTTQQNPDEIPSSETPLQTTLTKKYCTRRWYSRIMFKLLYDHTLLHILHFLYLNAFSGSVWMTGFGKRSMRRRGPGQSMHKRVHWKEGAGISTEHQLWHRRRRLDRTETNIKGITGNVAEEGNKNWRRLTGGLFYIFFLPLFPIHARFCWEKEWKRTVLCIR